MQCVFLEVVEGAVPAVRAFLDFLFYARRHSHTSETILRMRQALETFHEVKDVFTDLQSCHSFRIPKLHSMIHYCDAITRVGALDGFNSEQTERFHIDYAKKAYKATNGRDYVAQMTKWLQRCEAIALHESYLKWHATFSADAAGVGDLESEVVLGKRTYKVAKKPHRFAVSTQTLASHYGAGDFIQALNKFIGQNPHRTNMRPNPHDRFCLYNSVAVCLPETPFASGDVCRIRASPGHSNGPRKPPTPPYFDTVLVINNKDEGLQGNISPYLLPCTHILTGLRVARVRALFALPSCFGTFPNPLAYIHWFRPLTRIDPLTGMYRISPSTRNNLPNSEVICLDQIRSTCHLVPQYGSTVPVSWITGNVLDLASKFHLNKYLDPHIFNEHETAVADP
jgi:hypothetical protein